MGVLIWLWRGTEILIVSSAGFEKSVRSGRRALNLATGPDYVSRVDVFVDGWKLI